ncbi:tyrosine-type recombinase/integrase [Exilibacterium tricleocarpae]|uniref:Tyrosine-type recombinase/integrase n=1 Tax=Exilibacterium tricleocarpae TaxID=2591008 RepID=A0A545U6W9_9GAMM|nr:site-specific integrase [Exilibacterium tricleocarpae]TQV85231.1 tyrosine-type recombinase/integrase [Exilibacterium tricleocarpae]
MARKRNDSNSKLPPYTYRRERDGGYYLRPYLGSENGKPKFGKDIRLCGLKAPLSEIWKCWERETNQTKDTLRWLLGEYHDSNQFKDLSGSTQGNYEDYREKLTNRSTQSGKKWGDAPLTAVSTKDIMRYLDTYPAKISANRHIQYLKAVWNWGRLRYDQVPQRNPCMGVPLNTETPSERYVEDWEYHLVLDLAKESKRVPYLWIMMEIAYLCRARRGEVTNLKISDIRNGRVRLIRGKGSKGELTKISPRLQLAVDAAMKLHPNAPSPLSGGYLIHDKHGLPIKKNAFDSAWQRLLRKAKELGLKIGDEVLKLEKHFTYHNLKAKGVTDHTEQWAGHKSEKARMVYIRKLKEIDATR